MDLLGSIFKLRCKLPQKESFITILRVSKFVILIYFYKINSTYYYK